MAKLLFELPSLREPLEPLEGVVEEDPAGARHGAALGLGGQHGGRRSHRL